MSDQAFEFERQVNDAMLSGDPQLALLALAAVEEELGPDAAESVAQNTHDLYAQQHGPEVAASYISALGYTVADPNDGELVVGVDEDGDLVVSEEDAAALEAILGRELTADDLAAYLAEDDGTEEEDPRTMELEARLTAAEQRLLEQPQPAYEYEPTEEERQEQLADNIDGKLSELELTLGRDLSIREVTELTNAVLNDSTAELDQARIFDVDGSAHERRAWAVERFHDLERAHAEEQAEQPDTAQTWDNLAGDEYDELSQHQRRSQRVEEMSSPLLAGGDMDAA